LLDKSLKPKPAYPEPTSDLGGKVTDIDSPSKDGYPDKEKTGEKVEEEITIKKLSSITISGKVPLERYTELFNYFITPFAMLGNKLDIEVKFKIKSNDSSQLDETKPQYKSAKEAAKQLGLNFEEEES
jgi:hypothetical protein